MSANCHSCFYCRECTPPGQIVPVKMCARHPPTMIGTQHGIMSIQPGIPPTEFCGEWLSQTNGNANARFMLDSPGKLSL